MFSGCDWQSCFLSLKAQEVTQIILECSSHQFLLSDLNKTFLNLKGGLLCITFIAFQLFLELSLLKNKIFWGMFSFGGSFKDSLWTFPKPQIYQPEEPNGNNLLNKIMKTRKQDILGKKTASNLCIPYHKSDLCVCLIKRRVLFLPTPSSFSVSFDHWSGWPYAQGFFPSFDMDRFLKYSSPLGSPASSTWLSCDLMTVMQGYYSGHFVRFEEGGQTEWEKGHVCREWERQGDRIVWKRLVRPR